MEIRQLTSEDWEQVHALWQEAFPWGWHGREDYERRSPGNTELVPAVSGVTRPVRRVPGKWRFVASSCGAGHTFDSEQPSAAVWGRVERETDSLVSSSTGR